MAAISNWLEYFPPGTGQGRTVEEFGKPPIAMMNEIVVVGLRLLFPKRPNSRCRNVTSQRTRKAGRLEISPEQFARLSPSDEGNRGLVERLSWS